MFAVSSLNFRSGAFGNFLRHRSLTGSFIAWAQSNGADWSSRVLRLTRSIGNAFMLVQFYIGFVAFVHFIFALAEMFPWTNPTLLSKLSTSLPDVDALQPASIGASSSEKPKFTAEQQLLVATIVQNAGIYNAVVAGALLWTAFRGVAAYEFAVVLFIGVAVAGAFGTATIRSPITAGQCLLGIVGAVWIIQA